MFCVREYNFFLLYASTLVSLIGQTFVLHLQILDLDQDFIDYNSNYILSRRAE